MEFPAKLQELRKSRGLTQEELACDLCVSRTAISKWESGRGYPSIDSLRELSSYFHVSLDDLLSGGEALDVAQAEHKADKRRLQDVICGLLDCSMALLFVLPFFGQAAGDAVAGVPLLLLSGVEPYTKALYAAGTAALVVLGVCTLALQGVKCPTWHACNLRSSLLLSSVMVLALIASRQPYAAALTFVFLAIKAFVLLRQA